MCRFYKLKVCKSSHKFLSTFHEPNTENVHFGTPPPCFDTTKGSRLYAVNIKTKTKKSMLYPKRVGAAWAEKRKIEMEMEKKRVFPVNKFDASRLPNFGRVWQLGSRKDSKKEFDVQVIRSRSKTKVKVLICQCGYNLI